MSLRGPPRRHCFRVRKACWTVEDAWSCMGPIEGLAAIPPQAMRHSTLGCEPPTPPGVCVISKRSSRSRIRQASDSRRLLRCLPTILVSCFYARRIRKIPPDRHIYCSCASVVPKLCRRQTRAFGKRFQLRPHDRRMHPAVEWPLRETAIGTGDHVLAAEILRVAHDTLGDELGMLDDVGGMT